jgi:hypothetical protein
MTYNSLRKTIQERLEYAETENGFKPGSVFKIDDAAYKAILVFAHDNIDLASYVVTTAVRIKSQMGSGRFVPIPCFIEEDDVMKAIDTMNPPPPRTY